jgi:hypothetical protein
MREKLTLNVKKVIDHVELWKYILDNKIYCSQFSAF